MNHQPFYHQINFVELEPLNKEKIENIANKFVPRELHDRTEFYGDELHFVAYEDVSQKVGAALRRVGFTILDVEEAEPGDPSDLL